MAQPQEDEQSVTTLELFFDLVFVFAITQLTEVLIHEMSPLGVLQVTFAFIALWWMYTAYAWLTNTVTPDSDLLRLLLIGGMAGFLLIALATPAAFDDGGVAWGLGYLIVVLVHAGLFAKVNRRILRVLPVNVLLAVLIIAAGLADGPVVYVLWTLAVLIPVLVITVLRGHQGFPLKPGHLVERLGLAVIITFGESIIAIGIGVQAAAGHAALGLDLAVAAMLALALVTGLWWTYFTGDDERVEHALARAGDARRSTMAIEGYLFAHIPLVVGVIAMAAGLKTALAHPYDAMTGGPALALAGGVAAYLIGDVLFRSSMRLGGSWLRLTAAAAALALAPLGLWASVAEVAALVAVVVALIVAERVAGRGRLADLGQSIV